MEEISLAHGLLKYLHILLFVYWLGGDAGVFYSSKFVTNTNLSRDARLAAFKIFINLVVPFLHYATWNFIPFVITRCFHLVTQQIVTLVITDLSKLALFNLRWWIVFEDLLSLFLGHLALSFKCLFKLTVSQLSLLDACLLGQLGVELSACTLGSLDGGKRLIHGRVERGGLLGNGQAEL